MQTSAQKAQGETAAPIPDPSAAEQAVLGAVLSFADALNQARSGGLVGSEFSCEDHRTIWGAACLVQARGVDVDVITVFEQLRSTNEDERCGGLKYLGELAQSVLSDRGVAAHAGLIREAARRRQLASIGRAIERAATGQHGTEALNARLAVLSAELRCKAENQTAADSIRVEWARELPKELQPPPQIVENVLTAGGMSMFFGESNSGKSYLAIHLAICVSLGLPWLGRKTRQGAVLYIAAEGAWSIRLRLAAHRKHFDREIGTFGLIPQVLSLLDPSADVDNLIELVKVRLARIGEPVVLVVIDTVARVMGGGDENAAQDMSRLVGAGDRIREETGAHLLYIHHAGKDASRGARGHSSLRAALDTEIEVTADEATKTHTAHVTKQRDLPSKGDRLSAQFISVELGVDQWGGAVTACAVIDSEQPSNGDKPRQMTPTQRAVMGYLAGQSAGVQKATLRDALMAQGIHRASVYRALNDLLIAGLVTDHMGMVYAPKP